MIEPQAARWDGSFESFFAALDEACRRGIPPRRLDWSGLPGRVVSFGMPPDGEGAGRQIQPELFSGPPAPAKTLRREEGPGGPVAPVPVFSPPDFSIPRTNPSAALLFELSANAFDAVVHAWMSELPVGGELICFAWKVIAAARRGALPEEPPRPASSPLSAAVESEDAPEPVAGIFEADASAGAVRNPRWAALPGARCGAEKAASSRGDPDVSTVLEAAYRARREIDRLRGLLRFTPVYAGGRQNGAASTGKYSSGGSPGCIRGSAPGGSGSGGAVYIARCSPDCYILPGLADHFTRRFGECPWAVIDERRNLILVRDPGQEPVIFPLRADQFSAAAGSGPDDIETLWRQYHRSINNPGRNNPALQRQFLPRRYWKYLPELRD
jgi:probable DNA metabolism protein